MASDGVNKQTNKQTNGHCDSMTELAQWGRFSEKKPVNYFGPTFAICWTLKMCALCSWWALNLLQSPTITYVTHTLSTTKPACRLQTACWTQHLDAPSQTVLAWQRRKAVVRKMVTYSLNESVNDNGICRAAPGFRFGLLNICYMYLLSKKKLILHIFRAQQKNVCYKHLEP